MSAYLSVGAHRGQEHQIILGLVLQMVVSHPAWVLGTELASF